MGSVSRRTREQREGFTLVEMLAVIAIIGILAAIVVPNVVRYMAKARVTRAVAEIDNANTSLIGVLSDTGRSDFRDFLSDTGRQTLNGYHQMIVAGNFEGVRQAADFYREFFYELLRQGRESEVIKQWVEPEVRQKIGTNYIELGLDPWGQQYHFWMGPIRGANPLRSYRLAVITYDPSALEPDDVDFTVDDAYVWGVDARAYALEKLPGQPREDDTTMQTDYPAGFNNMFPGIRAYGFPAQDELPVYIWSSGPNAVNDANLLFQMNRGDDDANPAFLGGGDDPNNWDNESGWENAPKV